MNIQKTHKLTPFSLSIIFIFFALTCSLLFTQTTFAAINSEDLKDTIIAKCDFARPRYTGNKDSDSFKNFVDACKGSGDYEKNNSNIEERARRLLDICQYRAILKTDKYDAYNRRGATGYKDCDNIKSNAELKKLSAKAYPGAGLKTVNDPALKCTSKSHDDELECDLVAKYINPMISFLSAFVGIAVTIGIISGAIRYASAGDDPQKVSAAKLHIRGAILALLTFIFLYAAIQWLVPAV